MGNNKDISIEIQNILNNNELEDLKRFLKKRHQLNLANQCMMYLFHFLQSAGILTTTIAAGSKNTELIWFGVGLNVLASLINIYEKNNNALLKKMMAEIQAIREGNYVDEGALIDTDKRSDDDQKDKRKDLSEPLI